MAMHFMEANENFSPGDFHLQPVQVSAWGPLFFATVDLKAQPLSHFLKDVPARCAPLAAESMRDVTSKEWRIDCNWKVYVDNYFEGYHVSMVHPGLHKELDVDHYVVETHRYYSRQCAPLRALAPHATDRCHRRREAQKRRSAEAQKSRRAEEQKSRRAEGQKGRRAEEQKSRRREEQNNSITEDEKTRRRGLAPPRRPSS